MNNLISKTLLFLILLLSLFAFILSTADGYTDPFYVRFTTPPQQNLILGSSRSAQGLQPHVFDSLLNRTFFNYSFTNTNSPYGSVYFNSIQRKLDKQTKDGIFILSVDPWTITNNGLFPNDSLAFEENNLALANVKYVNMNPNFEYLIKQFKGQYYSIIKPKKKNMFLHEDGWLEITVDMDSNAVKKRHVNKMRDYRENVLPERKLSQVRLDYLLKTITYLKQYGKVYLVRIPMSPEMFLIEQELMPNFNEIMNPAISSADGYLDLTPDNQLCQYTDGNHLWKESGKWVSIKIAEWIKSLNQ